MSNNETNILYLTYDGLTDPLGRSQIIPYLRGLSSVGHAFTIISFEKKEKFKIYEEVIREELTASGIRWIPLKYSKTPPVLSTLWDLYKFKRKARQVVRSGNYGIVHCRSYLPGIIGRHLKKRFGLKFLFDIRGFWVDERVEGGIWDLKNPVYRLIYNYLKKTEKKLFCDADEVISLTDTGRKEIKNWHWLQQNKPVEVIPCCVDLKLFDYDSVVGKSENMREKLGFGQNDLIITYLGSIGTWYLLGEMLDFFSLVKEHYKHAKLFFITTDDEKNIMRTAIGKEIKPDDIKIISAPREKVPDLLSVSDIGLFFIKQVYSKKASSPTKQGEFMALGIPVICNSDVGDTEMVVNSYQSGYVVEKFTGEDYNKAVVGIKALLELDKAVIIKGAKEYFGLDAGIEKYDSAYRRLYGKANQ